MPGDFQQIIDHELSERRKSAIYFAVLTAATIVIAAALVLVML